jgi:hypothetical protein
MDGDMRFSPATAILALVHLLLSGGALWAQPRDLGSYVLFADTELRAHGLTVTKGNIGVNDGLLTSTNRTLLAGTSTVAASSVRLEERSQCAALFSNDVQNTGPGCTNAQAFVPPLLDLRSACGYPNPFPTCDLNAPVTVLKRGTQTLAPGVYGDVRVKNGGVLTLAGGDYVFCSLRVARRGKMVAVAPARLAVSGDFVVDSSTRVAPESNATPCNLQLFVDGVKASIQRRADVRAQLCAPNASLHIDTRAAVLGTFAAATIAASHVTATVAGVLECPGRVTTTTITTTTTTTSTTLVGSCGDGDVDVGEDCDPPGQLTCPGSAGGAFVACRSDCSCPFGPPVSTTTTLPASTTSTVPTVTTTSVQQVTTTSTSTTTTTLACGNGIPDAGEDCDPPGSLSCPGSVGGAFVACNADCTCPSASITTTTGPSSTSTSTPTSTSLTTTTLNGGSTTTTIATGSTTTTTLQVAELCGNCIDDDQNNLTDFEDPACCAQTQRFSMALKRGRIRPKGDGSRLRIRSGLASGGLTFDPQTQQVFLQIRPEGGSDVLCARVPAAKFMRMHGALKFWDQKHTVASAQGIDDMAIKVRRNGSVRFRTFGRRVRFTTPPAGNLQVTVAFFNEAAGNTANRCSTVTQPFRTGRGNRLLSP